MVKPTVLVCDAERDVRVGIKSYLSGENYDVILTERGEELLNSLTKHRCDIVIMETRLPDMDGYELCKQLRAQGNTPVIFLSRKHEEFDRVLGLKIGADDFMGKPFSLRELSARVEAVLRRSSVVSRSDSLHVAELTIYPEAYSVYVGGEPVELIPSDFKLLHYLAVNLGKVMDREKLLDAVWGIESTGSQRSIDTQIKRIRKAVCLPDVHFAIKSIYGVGYKMEVTK